MTAWAEGVPIVGEAKTRLAVRERSTGRCEVCWLQRATNMHHRQLKSRGGPWSFSNVIDLCGSGTTGCHGTITHEPAWAQQYGYELGSHETPELAPVLLWTPQGRAWWILTPDGYLERQDLEV